MRLLMCVVGLLWLTEAMAEDAAQIYAAQCASCHGLQALGNASSAPRLAGQNAAYLSEQLLAYQQGRRGTYSDDVQGQVMRAFARDLSAEQVETLSTHLATLPGPAPAHETDTEGPGAALYANHCAACHGQYGQGAESIFVPNLRILSAWYLDAQLIAYENGWRGGDEASTRAKNMRSMNGQLPDRGQRAAVIEHLAGPR